MIVNGVINWTLIFVPMILIPLIFMILGFSWFLSSFGVFLRDMGPLVNLFLMIWFFLTPVFYSIQSVPEKLRWIIYFNPMAYIVESLRRVVIWGILPEYKLYIVWLLISLMIMVLGYAFFKGTRKIFADAI
jgi:lipopolysaccharide transport system permease protein